MRKDKRLVRHELQHVIRANGVRFTLRRVRALGFGIREIEFPGWDESGHPGAALLRLLVSNEAASVDSIGVEVDHDTLASMSPNEIDILGLPRPCQHALRLKAQGALSDSRFRIEYAWLDHDGIEAIGLKRTGAHLSSAAESYTLLNPLYLVVGEVDALNAVQDGDGGRKLLDARMARMARLKLALAQATGDAQAGDYLRKLTIHHSTGLGIDASGPEGRERFHPTLFGDAPNLLADPEAEKLNEESTVQRGRLLPREHAEKFRATLFPNHGARSHYRLAEGVYVVVELSVQAALQVVENVNRAPAATRAAFKANPRSFLVEVIEQAGGTGDVLCGGTLLEGEHDYGERVLGVDEWTDKKLSFKTAVYRKWIPDEQVNHFTLDVPGHATPLMLTPGGVSELRGAMDAARGAGHQTVEFEGRSIPLTAEFVETVQALAGYLSTPVQSGGQPQPTQVTPQRLLVLRVAENEEDLVFNAGLRDPEGALAAGTDEVELRTVLRKHQVEALSWLKSSYLTGMPGVLLADDMGLGKTLEVLAFLAWLRATPGQEGHPILIVAPSKLLEEWLEQIAMHIGSAGIGRPVLAFERHLKGLRISEAHEGTLGSHTLDVARLRAADWVLTTYETLRDYHFSFAKVRFRVAVFDEAQKIKSMTSRMNNAARSQQSDFTILMTGTPVENELADLWTLLDVAWPGFLGLSAKAFVRTYGAENAAEARSELKEKLIGPSLKGDRVCPPIMLRRFKSDILTSLPARHAPEISEVMPEVQARKYDALLAEARDQRWPALKTLGALRTVSLHPDLRMPNGPGDHEALIDMSARFRATFRVLARVREAGERALIFVDLIRAQQLMQELVRHRFGLARLPQLINGETPAKATNRIKSEFQGGKGFDVLILGPKAAGFGLTLTAANHVVHLSRWWNPAVEDQCSDRVYRMGQEKEVTIHVPRAIHPRLGEESFDMVLDGLLGSKRALSREIVVPTVMTERDFADLFSRVSQSNASRVEPWAAKNALGRSNQPQSYEPVE